MFYQFIPKMQQNFKSQLNMSVSKVQNKRFRTGSFGIHYSDAVQAANTGSLLAATIKNYK